MASSCKLDYNRAIIFATASLLDYANTLMFEAFFRFGSIGMMCVIAVLIIRDGRQNRILQLGLALIGTLICLFLTTGSEELRITGAIAVPMRLFDMLNGILIWWLGLALFDDDFCVGIREIIITSVYVIVMLPLRLHYLDFDVPWTPGLDIFAALMLLALMFHLVYKAVIGRGDDLVESRRKMRIQFASAVAMLVVISIISERIAIAIGHDVTAPVLISYVLTFPLSLWAVLWLTQLHPEVLAFETDSFESDSHKTGLINSRGKPLDPRDIQSHQRLVKLIEDDRLYANHGLSIGALAEQVGMPEHQLRKLINLSMGYRNFSAFLNYYRVTEVKNALADPSKSRVPVLTLALNAGFSSLAPFQRAFKSSVGCTPTEYRTQQLANTNIKQNN